MSIQRNIDGQFQVTIPNVQPGRPLPCTPMPDVPDENPERDDWHDEMLAVQSARRRRKRLEAADIEKVLDKRCAGNRRRQMRRWK